MRRIYSSKKIPNIQSVLCPRGILDDFDEGSNGLFNRRFGSHLVCQERADGSVAQIPNHPRTPCTEGHSALALRSNFKNLLGVVQELDNASSGGHYGSSAVGPKHDALWSQVRCRDRHRPKRSHYAKKCQFTPLTSPFVIPTHTKSTLYRALAPRAFVV